MAKRAIIGRVTTTKRLRSSVNGNPRFEVTIHTTGTGERTFRTQVDSGLAYGIENPEYRNSEHVYVIDGRDQIERAFALNDSPVMFTSGSTTKDPHPWLESTTGNRYATREAFFSGLPRVYRPRPGFDNHNPILAQFREEVDAGHWEDENGDDLTAAQVAQIWLAGRWSLPTDTLDQLDHARRVLTKLSALD